MITNSPTEEIRFNSIPPKLRTLPQWVNWKAERRGDKTTKIPINPLNLQNAKSNDSSTWGLLDAAVSRINDPGISGIGFMFAESGISGIDLDHVRNAVTGEIEPWAFEIIRRVNSYTEVSPSGTGIHILVESTLPKEGSRKVGQVEVYDSGRFFTVTGDTLPGFTEIKQWEGKELHSFVISAAQTRQFLRKAFEAKNGEKFQKLYAGDWSEYLSQSEADMGLAAQLYFWTGSREETDRLFRQSGLFRPKWDEKHFADGRTYGEDILNKVCQGETYKRRFEVVNNEWSEIIPFDDYSLLPDFPIEALPELGFEIVKAVSEVNQVDTGMTASIYLSGLSASLAKKADINLISHAEPLNIYTCSILTSGNRKSSTMGIMTRAVYEYQARLQESMKDTIREALNAHKIREARLIKLQKTAANTDDPAERKIYEREAAEVAREISENPVPIKPLFIVDDVTAEALGIHMAENNERMAVMSTEGGIFDIMAGRYSDKNSNLDLYLKAHSGDPWSSHRVGREAKTMQSPALTMCLTVQPEVIREIGGNKQFRGRGLLARFLYSLCKTQAGYRDRQIKSIPESLTRKYRDHIFGLMDIPMSANTLRLSLEAQALWDEFYNDVETDLREGGSLHYLIDWGSKLSGAVARIAGLLHFAEHGAKALELPISVNIVSASCAIGGYFKEHALATFGLMEADPAIEAAKKILIYLLRHSPMTFKGRDVLRHTNFKTMDEVMPGVKVLIERGYIIEVAKGSSGTGRPEAVSYVVNPKIKMQEKH
jgi:hypothetical protein